MKVLIVGDFEFEIYEESFFNCFKSLGHTVEKFNLKINKSGCLTKLIFNASNKYAFGFITNRLNKRLLITINIFNPDLVFIYRGRQIYDSTYRKIKSTNNKIKVFYYNNDDFLSLNYPFYFWRHVKKSLIYFDHIFCYREKNISDLYNLKFTNTSILRSYYINKYNYIFNANFHIRQNDVVFVGHFEEDGRDIYLKKIIESGVHLKLYGTGWNKSRFYNYFVKELGEIKRLNLVEYNNVLNNSKIALVFLSKRNTDSYTRRCFEIPAAGCVMLSEETLTLKSLYLENKEILFFNSIQDAVSKIKYYLNNIDILESIAISGLKRLKNDKHEALDRINEIINIYNLE